MEESSSIYDEASTSMDFDIASRSSNSPVLPDKPKRKRPKFIRKVPCQVCGDIANDHVHYGAIACYSCRAFFRRGVTNNTPFYCAQDQKCQITKATRKHCQYCRFQKCVGIGMKADWVMTDEDKKEKKEISQQKKILNEVVADKAALKGATTQYEKRMRLERQLSRAEKRHTKIAKISILTDQTSSSSVVPRLVTASAPSPASSSTMTSADLNELTSERLTTSVSVDLTTASLGSSSNLAGNLKNICVAKSPPPPPVLQSSPSPAAIPSPSNSDINAGTVTKLIVLNKEGFSAVGGSSTLLPNVALGSNLAGNLKNNDNSTTTTTAGTGDDHHLSMVTASTAAVLYDYSNPRTVDSGYSANHKENGLTIKQLTDEVVKCFNRYMTDPSPCRKDSESDDNDEILTFPSDSAKTAQDILPTCSNNEQQMKNIILPLKKSCNEDFLPRLDIKSEPIMIFTSEERGFIQKLLQIELETSRAIPVPQDVMGKIITAARVGSVIPVDVAVKGYTVCMERVIKFASMVDFFKELSARDQFNLLLKNVDMVVNIRTARILKPGVNLRDQLSHAIGWKNRTFDQMALSFSSCTSNSPSSSTPSSKFTLTQQSDSSSHRRLDFNQMFPSPWASNAEFERKYCDLLKNIFDLNMDHMTTSLLTMMALFNTSISELEYPEAVKKVQDNFKKLLYRYLCSEIGKPNAMKLLPQYSETLRNLEEMANILATKRLRI